MVIWGLKKRKYAKLGTMGLICIVFRVTLSEFFGLKSIADPFIIIDLADKLDYFHKKLIQLNEDLANA